MAFYQILSWQDLPTQIKAWDDFDEINVQLPPRFMERVDRAAQALKLTDTDAYLAHWQWSEEQELPGSAAEVAEAVQEDLEENFQ